ncbi:MAG: response regulator [Chloroflexota bacterium]|nr:response regulator [Chloroflexota bacterium]
MKQILIVDDHADLRTIFEHVFRKHGYDVTVAVDGEQALEAIEANAPDLIVMDVNMPKRSGLDVLRQIRATPHLRHIKVMLVTGNYLVSQSPEIDLADLVLIKPIGIHELIELAQRLAPQDSAARFSEQRR